ncbi:MAG: hypothetical protein ABEJ35_05530 [Halobacteriaceae archaeon]
MRRRPVLVVLLTGLALCSGCLGFVTGSGSSEGPTERTTTTPTNGTPTTDAGSADFGLRIRPNASTTGGVGFDITVTNTGTTAGTARVTVIARAQNGRTYRKVRRIPIEPGEQRTVTVVFAAFDDVAAPTIRATVTRAS